MTNYTVMRETELARIIDGCRRFDRADQKALYQLFYKQVFSVALRYAASPDEAREMVNDAFFQVFTKMDRYDTAQPFLPWLNTIAVRTAIDYYRKYRKNEVELTSDENIPESVTNNHIVSKLAAEELRKLVQLLPPAYRMAINLYAIEGFSHGEIATMLGITEGASKSNLFKARAKLKQMIEEQNKTNKSAQS